MIDQIYQWFQFQFQSNEIFQGLVGGSLFGSVLYLLRGLPNKLYILYLRAFTCELTVFSEDPSFKWLCDWLAKQPYSEKARRIQVSTIIENKYDIDEKERWVIAPGDGPHLLWYDKRPIIVQREIRDSTNASRELKEKISIRFFGRSQKFSRKLLEEAKQLQHGEELIKIYSWNDGYWDKVTSKIPRNVDSLVLKEGQVENIIEDLMQFYQSSNWYQQRGIPWHRGYLFSGVPGTGKTTLAFILASYFNRPLYSLNLGSCDDDSSLMEALQKVPYNGILLLEDIDAVKGFEGSEHRNEILNQKKINNAKRKKV